MLVRIVTGIVGLVLAALGTTFTILGLVLDGAEADGFATVGPVLLLAGAASAAVSIGIGRREAARRRRRLAGPRTTARIVEARYLPGVRVGSAVAYALTVTFVPAGTASRTILVAPGTPLGAGQEIQVAYDPDDPESFEPVIDGLV